MSEIDRTDLPHRTFTVEEVERMADAGVLGEDERVELIEGELIVMSPQGPLHSSRVAALTRLLDDAYRAVGHVRVQLPLRLDGKNLPEPDLAVVRGQAEAFGARHPTGADTLLVVELSYSSARIDRAKAIPYARGGVATYWLVDLLARRVEVHTEPTAEGEYAVIRLVALDGQVDLPGLGRALPALDVLGR